jgi:hypothetical protein
VHDIKVNISAKQLTPARNKQHIIVEKIIGAHPLENGNFSISKDRQNEKIKKGNQSLGVTHRHFAY